MSSLEERIDEELRKQKAEIVKPNIVVAGGTGAGKSSLINRFFGQELAKIGNGTPVTKGMNRCEADNVPVVIFDTEGYEIALGGTQNRTNFDQNIKPEIERRNTGELKEQIHLVWYCISIATHRVTDYDLQNIEYFKNNNMKTAVVLTQCDLDEELPDGSGKDATIFKNIISEKIPDVAFFETCASRTDLLLNLEGLQRWSSDALPDDQLKQSFIAAQKISIPEKKREAYRVVRIFAISTGTSTGLNPLPLSDSALIVPQQFAMCVKIGAIFNFDTLTEAAGSLVKSQLLSLAGRQLAVSLLKLAPVLGQAINAAVAAALTYGLGMALTEIYAKLYEEVLVTGKLPDWSVVFTSENFMAAIERHMQSYKKSDI
jgi:uncharacterized protein (DUF697 family)/GTP-binding protein EngB required for normal cell division